MHKILGYVTIVVAAAMLPSCVHTGPNAVRANLYSMDDFARTPKFDSHIHANVDSQAFVEQAEADGFEILSINVDYGDFPSIEEQSRVAKALRDRASRRFHYAGTFPMSGWGRPGWALEVQNRVKAERAQGAVAIKIWKNIGMEVRDPDGKLGMIDDPRFAPVLDIIRVQGMPLIGHQGEPYNAWLPLEQMTTANDRAYFASHPKYHMFLQPEMPSYAAQMAARDRMVSRNPELVFIGAHMGSLEWDVGRLAKFLDAHPNASVDLAARMSQVQHQSVRNRDRVRSFFIKYQDRILYGSDLTHNPGMSEADFKAAAHRRWTSDWRYLATHEPQRNDDIDATVPGLALPRSVIDKIFYHNARRAFLGKKASIGRYQTSFTSQGTGRSRESK